MSTRTRRSIVYTSNTLLTSAMRFAKGVNPNTAKTLLTLAMHVPHTHPAANSLDNYGLSV